MFFKKKKRDRAKKRTVVILDTNIPLDCAKFQNLEFLNGLEVEAEVFVPWAVCKELITFTRMAEEDREILEGEDFEKYMEWQDKLKEDLTRDRPGANLTPERAESIIKSRIAQASYAKDVCSFVQEKINSGKWRTIGTPKQLKVYLDGFDEKIKEAVDRRRADLEVLACCILAAEQRPRKKIVLMTLDRRLRNIAEGKFGIPTHKGARDKSRLFKN